MKVIYRPHLLRRLKERRIPRTYPKKILQEAEEEYFDLITDYEIAIKKLQYASKLRNMVVVYDIIDNNHEIITIYPISDSEIKNKVKSGRWKKYEKN